MIENKLIQKALIFLLLFNTFIPFSGYIISLILLSFIIIKKDLTILNITKMEKNFILIFVSYIIFTILVSHYKSYSIIGFLIFAINIALYLIIRKYGNTSDFSEKFLETFINCSIIISVIGIFQFYLLKDIAIPSSWVDQSVYSISMRAFSTLLNPNILGGYLIFVICILVTQLENKTMPLKNKLALLVGTYCLTLTYSRGAWLTLFLMIIIAFILRKKMIYILYGLFFYVLILLGNNSLDRLSVNNALKDNSLMYRIEIYKAVYKIIRDNLFTGTGLNTMQYYINEYSNSIKAPVYHAHNFILNIWGELGLIGVLFLCIIFVCIFRDLVRFQNKTLGFSLLLAFSSILVQGIFDAVIITPQLLIYIVCIIGVVRNISQSTEIVEGKIDAGEHI